MTVEDLLAVPLGGEGSTGLANRNAFSQPKSLPAGLGAGPVRGRRQLLHPRLADRRQHDTGVRPEVHVTAWMSVNGTRRALIVDPTVDLASEPSTLGRLAWVLPEPPDL